ncbi:MAG: BtrH N-terminal domain-containing protein [Anaerolineae bacterium]|nr:BtrH N-terminal domain-containing protein [Anaerolineae bacterium]
MPKLSDYTQFGGLHPDTGPIRNALDYQGVRAPHTGKPLSEALLFGISGGVVAAYFTFDWHGQNPWFHFLTRISFNPMEKLIERLGLPTAVKHTDKPDKAVKNLLDALEAGKAPLVWADIMMLPYSNRAYDEQDWLVMPLIVYGLEADTAYIADRASVPLMVTTEQLAAARGRVKQEKYRVMTLGTPDLSQLPAAVEAGIRTCIGHFTEPAPIKPLQGKFGFDAYQRWADWLVDAKHKEAWPKKFATGGRLYTGLTSGFNYIELMGTGRQAARGQYADFLDEAAAILNKPALKEAAVCYREAAARWTALTDAMLPDSVPLLKEARDLLVRDYELFRVKGNDSLPERQQISARLKALDAEAKDHFPMSETEAAAFREGLRERVLKMADAEKAAVAALQGAVN